MMVKITGLAVVFVALVISCSKDSVPQKAQSEAVQRYLEFRTKMSALNASAGQMSNFLSVIGASQLRNNMVALKSATGDSIDGFVPGDSGDYWDFWTCATVTETDNADSTHTTVYDYGEECDEYGTLFRGKITYIWKSTGNDYYSKVIYEDYYSYGMEMNGFSEYSFTSESEPYYDYDTAYEKGDSAISPGIVFYWSGTSTAKDDITMTYDSGEKYAYTSDYATKWDNSTYTVLNGEYSYISEPDGYEYHYEVSAPLVYNYECTDTWIAVSGIETIHYKDSADTYDFLIDYGNGNCDNLATVTENGETSVVDFGDLIYTYCGTEAAETVSSNKR